MLLQNTPEKFRFTPEIAPQISGTDQSEWLPVFDRIVDGQDPDNGLPSYGAYHFVGGGLEASQKICERICEINGIISLTADTSKRDRLSQLHRDRGTQMAATVLYCIEGEVEMLFFIEVAEPVIETPHETLINVRRGDIKHLNRLFTKHVIDPKIGFIPEIVQQANPVAGDTVLFDHRIPHVVKRVSKTRRTKGYFST